MLLLRIKKIWKNEYFRLFLISLGIAIVYELFFHANGALRILSDSFFLMGIVHLVVACIRYIRNVGLFKTFSYSSYKRHWKKDHKNDPETRPMSLAEYTEKVIYDDMRQKPVLRLFITSFAFWAVSVVFMFLMRI